MTAFMLFLFGACAFASAIIAASWSRLTWERWHEPKRRCWLVDRYFMVRACLAVGAVGIVILCGLRTFDVWTMRAVPSRSAATLMVAMILLLLSKAGLVWTATLNSRSPSWRVFVSLTILWAFTVILWWTLG